MINPPDVHVQAEHVVDAVAAARTRKKGRLIVAIAGPPGSGKSTFTEGLWRRLDEDARGKVAVMPLDGYHMDNAVLTDRGWLDRKGVPHTFDVDALATYLKAVRTARREVLVPVFDRTLDLSRAIARPFAEQGFSKGLAGGDRVDGKAPNLDQRTQSCRSLNADIAVADIGFSGFWPHSTDRRFDAGGQTVR